MKNKRLIPFMLAVFTAVSWQLLPAQKAKPKKPKAKPSPASLIKKELLAKEPQILKQPRRNIFVLAGPSIRTAEAAAADRPPGSDEELIPGSEKLPEGELAEEEAPLFSPVRYVGFVRSPLRIVALIVFEGEELAVKKGDIIGENTRILDVTRDELEYMGADGATRKVLLEGEER